MPCLSVQALHTAYQETCGDCPETIAKDREEADIIGDNFYPDIICDNIHPNIIGDKIYADNIRADMIGDNIHANIIGDNSFWYQIWQKNLLEIFMLTLIMLIL